MLFAEPRVGDAQLSAALDRAPGTVVAAATVPFALTADTANATSMTGLGWGVASGAPVMPWADVTAPRPELRRPGGIAVVTVQPDDDGVVRRVALLHRAGNAVLPAIGLAGMARRADTATVPSVGWTPSAGGGTLHLGERSFPVDSQGHAELWYPRTLDGLTTIRFDRLARAALTTDADPALAALIRDRCVFVGSSALMLDYSIQTPRGRIAGVDFARLSAVLLAQERVLRLSVWPWDLLLFVVAFVVPFAVDSARRDTPARLVAALPLAWIAVHALSVVLLLALQQRTALVTPLVAALGATGALGMQELVRLRRERLRLVAERLAAERATDLKTRFVNHVAHELRTPLSAILGFSRLLGQDGSGAGDRHDYAQVILRNSTHLLRLVNNLLDDARLATGHLAADPQPSSVRQVVRDVVATIDGLPRGEGVAVQAQIEPDVPERLLIDELRVRQIVLNLVANAAKFTEQGHIRIEVGWRADVLTAAVEDTGPGIEPAACDRVFEEFEFGSPAAARAGGIRARPERVAAAGPPDGRRPDPRLDDDRRRDTLRPDGAGQGAGVAAGGGRRAPRAGVRNGRRHVRGGAGRRCARSARARPPPVPPVGPAPGGPRPDGSRPGWRSRRRLEADHPGLRRLARHPPADVGGARIEPGPKRSSRRPARTRSRRSRRGARTPSCSTSTCRE